MNITYHYTKQRKHFGMQPMFCMAGPHLLDDIPLNNNLQKEYMLRNPVSTASQCCSPISENEMNTIIVTTSTLGINHVEGGWPKDVNFWDDEATNLVRRRAEREEKYIDAVLDKSPEFVHYIKQNNAINIYQSYYEGMSGHQPPERTTITVKNKFRDPLNRPISSMSWCIEHNKLVVSYCSQPIANKDSIFIDNTCYMWDIEKSLTPIDEIHPPNACCQIACSPQNGHTLVGGLNDGRVCVFDLRVQTKPISISPENLAHLGPVTSLIYMNTRVMTEMLSGSTDGACIWWDIRNLSKKTDELIMCINAPPGEARNLSNAEGVTSLHYDKASPTRFLCGTVVGHVVNVNRKGKTYNDIMAKVFDAHIGPVKTVQRSPNISKLFITCGDYSAHIWNDDVTISPIITGTSRRFPVNDVCWCPTRVSRYMSVSGEGRFCLFDLLRNYHEPLVSQRVTDCPLLKLKAHNEEDIVALADAKGTVHLLSLSDNFVPAEDRNKELMNQLVDRESRREHILENRAKEIKLKLLLQSLEPKQEAVVEEELL